MKRAMVSLILSALLLTGCADESAQVSTVERVGPDDSISLAEFNSIQDVCAWSNTIVKAKYLSHEELSSSKNVFKFEVEENITGNCDEEIISIHESVESSFITGKSYYLFLSGYRSALYPYVVYTRVCPDFLVGEIDEGYTFYENQSLQANEIADMTLYLKDEIVSAGKYVVNDADLVSEPLEEACDNAAGIAVVEFYSVKPRSSRTSFCSYEVQSTLKSLPDDPISNGAITAPASAEEGDRYILLYAYNGEAGAYKMYPNEHALYSADSAEGRTILEKYGAEAE